VVGGSVLLSLHALPAVAFNIPVANSDLTVTLDSTVELNILGRTEGSSPDSYANPNGDDVANNFKCGLAATRVDLDTGLNVKYEEFGFRISGAAWYDLVYDLPTGNPSPNTINYSTGNENSFSDAAKGLAGHRVELDDAFTFGALDLSDGERLSYRIGQFVQIFGQELFLSDGIGGAMNPVDAIRAQLLLNPQSRDVFMSTPQISAEDQFPNGLILSAYYKLGYRPTRIPPGGSYFSTLDIVGAGSDEFFEPLPGLPNGYFQRMNDVRPNGGDKQFGFAVQDNIDGVDYGLYGLNYDALLPEAYIHLGGTDLVPSQLGTYQFVYPRDAQLIGASFSSGVNIFGQPVNLAGEISERHHEALVSPGSVAPLSASDDRNVFYPVGDVLRGQVSFIYESPPLPQIGSQLASISGEIGVNKLLSVFENAKNLYAKTNGAAVEGEVVFGLNYLSILPGVDMNPSLGIYYNPMGNSADNGGVIHGSGSTTLADTITIDEVYNVTVQYRHYIGSLKTTLGGVSDPSQGLYGKDFAALEFNASF
jgi:hypothetical protein